MKSILEGKKKLLAATGAVVVAVSLALGIVITDISKDTKAIESYPIISQLEQSDFRRNIAKNESFESLLERNNLNVTKINNQSKSALSEQLSSFKKYLLGLYSIDGISPNECKVSKEDKKWYLIINSSNEKIELNEYCTQTCESIAAIQGMLRQIDTEDYTESVSSKSDSKVISYDVEGALDEVSDSYKYLK